MSALKLLKPDEIDVSGTASFISGQNLSASERMILKILRFQQRRNSVVKHMQTYRTKNLFHLQIQINYKLALNIN